jgi:hypothetical protein
MTVIGALSSFRESGEMSPHIRPLLRQSLGPLLSRLRRSGRMLHDIA